MEVVKTESRDAAKLKPKSSDQNEGRRWVKFACEKHRREHARCPDTCAMRKNNNIEDTFNADGMQIQPQNDDIQVSQDDEEQVNVDEN